MYYYRLEAPWSDIDEYFDNPLSYTCTRAIDRIEEHDWPLVVGSGQDVCGLWVLEGFSEVVAFWEQNPSVEEARKSEAAYRRLARLRCEFDPGRFCIRIDPSAFGAEVLYPDKACEGLYETSKFHPVVFDTLGRSWRINEIDSERVPSVNLPDNLVEVFYRGFWYPKSREFGDFFVADVLEAGNIDGAIPTHDAVWAPRGTLS